MKVYLSRNNEITDENGKQIAVILPTNTTMAAVKLMAKILADRLTNSEVLASNQRTRKTK